MALEDFEFQLQAEQRYTGAAAGAAGGGPSSTYVDPTDGTVYEWDERQKGWVPKIDDDFLARYQASYGVAESTESPSSELKFATPSVPPDRFKVPSAPPPHRDTSEASSASGEQEKEDRADKRDNTEAETEVDPKKAKVEEEKDDQKKGKKGKPTPTWFEMDEDKNCNVYVSNLPLDITEEELLEIMTKCGIIMEDDNGKPKLKLYKDADGQLKGDALCCYLKKESIPLALNIIDGSVLRDHTISVEKAQFTLKGEYDPKKKRKKPKKKGSKQTKLLDWRERREGPVRKKCERIIVFKNVFDPKEFDEDPTVIMDIRGDIQEECSKFGQVKKILIFDRHPEGLVSVAFKEFEPADMCILKMNQRWYGGRQLEVAQWDGITNFQVEETDRERGERLKKWEDFLHDEEEEKHAEQEEEEETQEETQEQQAERQEVS